MFISIICAFIYIGTKDFTKEVIVDNERFDQDYKNVSKDNVFVYANANDIYTVLKGGTGIIYMGFKENYLNDSFNFFIHNITTILL